MREVAFLVPGALDQLTGGYLYDRRIIEGLRGAGTTVRVCELSGRFPDTDAEACAAAEAAFRGLPGGTTAVIDGLALPAFAECIAAAAERLAILALVHHPLADETGLAEAERARFAAVERAILPRLRGALCPSRRTARSLEAYGVAPEHIVIAPPGTDRPEVSRDRSDRSGPVQLLSVATLTPRKGHRLLIEALGELARLDWHLQLIGSTTRDPATAADVAATIAALGLDARVYLAGERPPAMLGSAYRNADVFVLPSFDEGYGMALAEALAHGLPIIATTAGAIPDTVPPGAGLLVPPGDRKALAGALGSVIADRALRSRLAAAAAAAGSALPSWGDAVALWRAALERLAA